MPQEHKIVIEILDEDDEGIEYFTKLLEIAITDNFPDEVKWELIEYED